jgi:hypothetical protein
LVRNCGTPEPLANPLTSIPTFVVYPNALLSFGVSDWQNTQNITASLFLSGSMKLVVTNASARNGFAMGSLPAGDYILIANATFGRSFTSDYFGIKQIESANYTEGNITISVGLTPNQPDPSPGSTPSSITGFPSLEEYPLTLSSPTVIEDVNLSSIGLISGNWIKFLPSFLPEVGPNGTEAEMLLAGETVLNPLSNLILNGNNNPLIIEATAGGANLGEVALPAGPLENSNGFVVLRSMAPNQEFLGSVAEDSVSQSNLDIQSIIYDPESGYVNQTLPVSLSIAGFLGENGQVLPQPSWLEFAVSEATANRSIIPYAPLYFALHFTAAGSAPAGLYTLVVDVEVGSINLTLFIPVDISPAAYGGQ